MDENNAEASRSKACEALQVPKTELASTAVEAASSLFTATRKAGGRLRSSGSKLKSPSKPKNSINRRKSNSRSMSSTRKTKSTPTARSRNRKTTSTGLKKPNVNCVSRKRNSRISIKHNKGCRPNLTMNKAYLQFIREYCGRPQELSGPDLAQKAARAWCRLSNVKKQKFLARRTKKTCKKARFCAIQ
ncbi:uncharacterized protein [Drosophila virilis]|uniref:HMG box domain-containing protein n=1 Tax=Drosophila virilis TaxID=7244 RepID=A0A0Q9WMX7_DROVI|nr:uncharacterized protein LOC6631825 [Drosophila virilis]KRF82206.1 uncharacterized protein Dvir_GJ18925 [Drosophila virilis]